MKCIPCRLIHHLTQILCISKSQEKVVSGVKNRDTEHDIHSHLLMYLIKSVDVLTCSWLCVIKIWQTSQPGCRLCYPVSNQRRSHSLQHGQSRHQGCTEVCKQVNVKSLNCRRSNHECRDQS